MSRKAAVIIFFALAIGLNLFGCKGKSDDGAKSDGRPSEAEGKAALTKHISGDVKLVSFRKTNGLTDAGSGRYQMEYECEVEYTRDCRTNGPFSTYHGPAYPPPTGTFDIPAPGVPVKKGSRVKINGEIWFEKTENGWRVTSIGP